MATKLNAGAVQLTTAGWAANVGLVEAITPPERPVYIDREAHASLYDGARLAGTRAVTVRHNESADLGTKIAKHGPGVVCIDALYSGDGSIPDLEAYVRVCEERDCVLILDEAHSFGILGADGGGLAAGTGLTERVHFRTGSLSKALGGHGGFLAADSGLIRSVRARLRPGIFSSATSAVLHAGHHAALEVAVAERVRAHTCLELGRRLATGLRGYGLDVRDSRSQIVSITLQGEQTACRVYGELRSKGILASVFLPPAVPRGTSVLRFSVYCELSQADIDEVVVQTSRAVEETAREAVLRIHPPPGATKDDKSER